MLVNAKILTGDDRYSTELQPGFYIMKGTEGVVVGEEKDTVEIGMVYSAFMQPMWYTVTDKTFSSYIEKRLAQEGIEAPSTPTPGPIQVIPQEKAVQLTPKELTDLIAVTLHDSAANEWVSKE